MYDLNQLRDLIAQLRYGRTRGSNLRQAPINPYAQWSRGPGMGVPRPVGPQPIPTPIYQPGEIIYEDDPRFREIDERMRQRDNVLSAPEGNTMGMPAFRNLAPQKGKAGMLSYSGEYTPAEIREHPRRDRDQPMIDDIYKTVPPTTEDGYRHREQPRRDRVPPQARRLRSYLDRE